MTPSGNGRKKTKKKRKRKQDYNPHLKAIMLEIVGNQLRENNPPEARETYERLQREGFSKEDAKKLIGQAVCVEIWDAMTNHKPFNEERYKRNLKRLPNEPEE